MLSSRLALLALLLALVASWSGPKMFVGADEDDEGENNGETCSLGEDDGGDDYGDNDELPQCDAEKSVTCGATRTAAAEPAPTESPTSEATTSEPQSTTGSESTDATSESSTTANSSEPCDCQLMEGLKQQSEVEHTEEEKESFSECLNEVRSILIDEKIAKKRKMPKIGKALKKWCKKNEKNKKACKKIMFKVVGYKNTLHKFISCGKKKDQKHYAKKLFTFDSEGKCAAFNAIEKHTENDKCGPGSTSKILAVLSKCKIRTAKKLKKENEYDDDEKHENKQNKRKQGWFKKCLKKKMFVELSDYKKCVLETKIPEFDDDLDQLLEMSCDSQEQSNSMGTEIFKGGKKEEIEFYKSVEKECNDKESETDAPTHTEAKTFSKNIGDYCDYEQDVQKRLMFVKESYKKLSKKCKEHVGGFRATAQNSSLEYDNDTTTVADVVETSSFCNYSDCGNTTDDKGSSSVTLEEANSPDAQNKSDTSTSINEYYNTMPPSQKPGFNSYKNSCNNCIYAATPPNGYGSDKKGRLACTKYFLGKYEETLRHPLQKLLREFFFKIRIYTVFEEQQESVDYERLGYASTCTCRS